MSFRNIFSLTLLLTAVLLFSCKPEEPGVEESPFFRYFNESDILVDTVAKATSSWDYGFVFSPLEDGEITELGIKMPATGNFDVGLWNLSGSTPQLLRSERIVQGAEHAETFVKISPLQVEKNAKLGVFVLADAFYRIGKQDGSKFPFPQDVNNIRIESFNEAENSTGAIDVPRVINDTRVAPCVNVIFIVK